MVVNTEGRGWGQRDVLIAGHWCNKSNTNRNAIGMSLLYGILINGPRGALLEARTLIEHGLSAPFQARINPIPDHSHPLFDFSFILLFHFFFLSLSLSVSRAYPLFSS